MPSLQTDLQEIVSSEKPLTQQAALFLLQEAPLSELMNLAESLRLKYFQKKVQVHILDNIKNGHCPEDCSYCAQRKSEDAAEIPEYATKPDLEILKEAEEAYKAGAYRFCIVTSGRGPTETSIQRLANTVKAIKDKVPLRICLSAGILKKPEHAKILAEAGLDRYNHNLNTSEEHYGEICTSHTFQDRLQTLNYLKGEGVSLCSGVIAGMGESEEDLASVAIQLRTLEVPSIPVNFFLPVPGHDVKDAQALSSEKCLRILAMFRIANPSAEIRMAAGREIHIADQQTDALRVANSLFVSGYLNTKGSNAAETYAMLLEAGYEIDAEGTLLNDVRSFISDNKSDPSANDVQMKMKDINDLRPYANR